MEKIRQLSQWLEGSKYTVFLGGAGVSTASGIPDFRSAHGLYQKQKQGLSYEEMLSHEFFMAHPEEFYDFLREVMLYPEAKPNRAHLALAKLERHGRLQRVITQNIDGLHQMAGSKKVIELHGNESRYFCMACQKQYTMTDIVGHKGAPKCSCGGRIRPDVVLYGEMLNQQDLAQAVRDVEKAELLLVGGTSLVVYPVAGLINYLAPGGKLVILNRDETPFDSRADLIFREDLGQVLEAAVL